MTAEPGMATEPREADGRAGTNSNADSEPGSDRRFAPESLPKPVPTTLRRRGAAIALGLAIVIVGALAFLNVLSRFSETVEVVRIDNDVPRGGVIAADDLASANIVTDPSLDTLPAGRTDDIVGLRASTDLVAGTLLSESSLTSAMVPGEGERLVGVAVSPAQLPGEPLVPGDVIHVVQTPGQGEPLSDDGLESVEVTVLQTYEPGDDGKTKVDVLVSDADAFWLAAMVATENIAIVLDTREQ